MSERQLMLRIPAALAARLREAAKRSGRSLNSEIDRRLRFALHSAELEPEMAAAFRLKFLEAMKRAYLER
jgi:hypothetical protein